MTSTPTACPKCGRLPDFCDHREIVATQLAEPRQPDTSGKLTKWEAGNELVALADACSKAAAELKDWPNLAAVAAEMRSRLVVVYEREGLTDEMGFGI